MKLYMFYVGGGINGANVELHDVRFAVGATPEACHEELRRQWWGDPASLHLDCWGAVEQADGFDIELVPEPVDNDGRRLFFANMGGYDPALFAELHRNTLVVAPDAASAKKRAIAGIRGWTQPHKDALFEIEHLLDLAGDIERAGLHLHLTPARSEKPFSFRCEYLPIARAQPA